IRLPSTSSTTSTISKSGGMVACTPGAWHVARRRMAWSACPSTGGRDASYPHVVHGSTTSERPVVGFAAELAVHGERIAIIDAISEISYRGLDARVRAAAAELG